MDRDRPRLQRRQDCAGPQTPRRVPVGRCGRDSSRIVLEILGLAQLGRFFERCATAVSRHGWTPCNLVSVSLAMKPRHCSTGTGFHRRRVLAVKKSLAPWPTYGECAKRQFRRSLKERSPLKIVCCRNENLRFDGVSPNPKRERGNSTNNRLN
jgi:hypothetical protein